MIRSLSELVKRTVAKALEETRSSMPAKVISYDASRRVAQVQILQPELTSDGKEVAQPVIAEVPVFMPIGGAGSMTFPVSPGDEGIAVFADQDIGGYVRDGDTSKPDSGRRHSLTDAMFYPGVVRGGADADNVVITCGSASITLQPGGKVVIDAPNGLEITGSGVTHNGTNIGDDHVHPISGGSSAPGPTEGPK